MSIDQNVKLTRFAHTVQVHLRSFMNGLGQLSRAPMSSIAIFVVIGVALALPMGLFVALDNFGVVMHGLKDSGQISLYLKKTVPASRVDYLKQMLEKNKEIASIRYVSPQEGLQEFMKASGFSKTLSGLNENPLPGVLLIEPSPALHQAWQVQRLYEQVKNLPEVAEAQLDLNWLKRLQGILSIAHRIAVLLMLLFALAVVFVVGNTISLTTKAYSQEIRIIKVLGGSNRFIRLPFLYSGLIYGLTGAIVAWFIVDFGMWALSTPIQNLATLYGDAFQLRGMDGSDTFYLLIVGMLLGYLGAWFAVRRQLKASEVSF